MARDRVSVNAELECAKPVFEIALPYGLVPLHLRRAPDIVDEYVESTLFVVDSLDKFFDLFGDRVIDCDRDP